MLDIIKHQQWIVIALVFFGILAYIAIIRCGTANGSINASATRTCGP